MGENTATLVGNFNFRVTLRKSANAEAGAPGAAGSAQASASFSAGASASAGIAGVNASASLSLGAGAGVSAGATLGEGGFQECSGLELEMDVQELVEGGRNDGVIRRVGRGKYAPLVLKRGMFVGSGDGVNADLWLWLQGILTGQRPVVRYDGTIEVLSHVGNRDEQNAVVRAKWVFVRALPQKVAGPSLNAKNGDIAMEELHIVHEGLRLEVV